MAAAESVLTAGAIAAISEDRPEATGLQPVLQIADLRLVNTANSTAERYRTLLSDGLHSQQAMLATSLNALVKDASLRKGTVLQLKEFICSVIQNRRIIIVISLEVLRTECEMIGSPKLYDVSASASENKATKPGQSSSVNPAGNEGTGLQHSSGARMTGRTTFPQKAEPGLNNSSYSESYSGSSGLNSANANTVQPRPEQRSAGYNSSGNAYRQPAQVPYQQPNPMYVSRGPIAKNEAPARIVPIAALNPYQGRWTIKARVTAKTQLRRYHNPRGEGQVFSFDLLDAQGGEIRATCFNLAAEQFYNMIETGRVYLISRGTLKISQKNFNHLNNDYEITLDSTSAIQPCPDEDESIPKQQFNFRPVSEVQDMENNSMVDLIGIVTSISPAGSIMRKNGTETQKQTLQLKDRSGCSVEITLWGDFCGSEGQQLQSLCESGTFPVLALKAARVSDFSGKSVGTISSSQLLVEPDLAEARGLREWYSREGRNAATLSISREVSMGRTDTRKTVAQIKDENLGRSEKPDWITVKATITFIKQESFYYTACPLMVGDRACNKKVNNNGDGTWQCDRCDKSFPECDYRYLLQFQIQDHTGVTWVTAFQESGEDIMGVPAKELHVIKYVEQDDARFGDLIRGVLFNQFIFKLKVKEETYSDEQRVKLTVVKAEKLNPSSENRYLLGAIDKALNEASTEQTQHQSYPQPGFIANTDVKPSIHPTYGSAGISIGNARYADTPNQYRQRINEDSSFLHRAERVDCNNCGSNSHSTLNCPSSMSRQNQGGGFQARSSTSSYGGGGTGTDSNVCFKCQQPGHWARDCPGAGNTSSGMTGRYTKQYVGASGY